MSRNAWIVLGLVALLAYRNRPVMRATDGSTPAPFSSSNPDPAGSAGNGNTNPLTALMGAVQNLLGPRLTGPGNTPMLSASTTPASLPGDISAAAGGTPTVSPYSIDPFFYNPMYDSPDGYFDINTGMLIPHNY